MCFLQDILKVKWQVIKNKNLTFWNGNWMKMKNEHLKIITMSYMYFDNILLLMDVVKLWSAFNLQHE